MRLFSKSAVVAALSGVVITFLAMPAQTESPHRGAPHRIALPDGFQPEGITSDGRRFLYVGSLDDGAIWRADSRTGGGRLLAQGREPRAAAGMEYDRRCDRLWVAGAETHRIRVHDPVTGERLRTYGFGANERFVNDLVVTRWGVFATDSMNKVLLVVRFREGRQYRCDLPPRSARTLKLSGDLVMQPGFNLNGIVRIKRSLVSVQTNTGNLFRINPFTGATHRIRIRGGSLVNGDGIERGRNGLLYVVRNQEDRIVAVQLNKGLSRGRVVSKIADTTFDVPTGVARIDDTLFVVNARFGTAPEPDTQYWITRIRRR